MKALLEYLLTAIVDHPEAVVVETSIDPNGFTLLTATVSPEDMGKVIGKGGKVINSIRKIVKIKALRENLRVNVSLAETGEGVARA